MRRYMCVGREGEGDPARKRSKNRFVDTKNKGSSRLVVVGRPWVPAGVRLIVVSNRLYSGILIRSQLTELAVVYGTSKTSARVVAEREPWIQAGGRVSTRPTTGSGSSRHLRRTGFESTISRARLPPLMRRKWKDLTIDWMDVE